MEKEYRFSTLNNNKKLYDYKSLIKKDDLKILKLDIERQLLLSLSRRTIVSIAKYNSVNHAQGIISDKGVLIFNSDINIRIVIGRNGILHSLEKKRTNIEENIVASLNIGLLLKNAIAINELKPRNNNCNGSIIFINIMNYDDEVYIVRIIVNENRSYESLEIFSLMAINTKKEDATHLMVHSGLQPVQQSSTLSIKELLNYCKNIENISGSFSQDVKKVLDINYKNDLSNLKY